MSQEDAAPLWDFVPLQEYSVPAAPAAERVRGGLGKFFYRLRGASAAAGEAQQAKPEAPPLSVLDKAAPAPSWSGAVQALDAALGQWAEGGGPCDDNVRVVVGPSGAAADDVVGTWARFRRWRMIDPPGIEQILAGGVDGLAGLPGDNSPKVLERLDRFYLRHHDGLDLLERLIERLSAGQERFLIGCGSWSWTYLTRALRIDVVLGQPLALQALDHRRLRDWIGELAADRFDFHQRGKNGASKDIGKRGRGQTEDDGNGGDQESDFLRKLSAFSRGIPLVAWEAWRNSLRLGRKASAGAAGKETRLWVSDWSELDFPDPPTALGPCQLALLHETLLQGTTTMELLAQLLPFPTAEIINGLHQLRKTRLLESEPGGWRVTRLGYPAARELLQEAGYLTGGI